MCLSVIGKALRMGQLFFEYCVVSTPIYFPLKAYVGMKKLFQDISLHVMSAYSGKLGRHSFSSKLQTAVEAIALCHNVTPTEENGQISYQAASPDEVVSVT